MPRNFLCHLSRTVHFLQFPNIAFPIFVYKFLQFPILCFSNSSNFQKIYVISVAASPLNKGWFKIQLKTPAHYSLQILGFPHVQFYNFQIFEFPILEFRHITLEIVGSELYFRGFFCQFACLWHAIWSDILFHIYLQKVWAPLTKLKILLLGTLRASVPKLFHG